MKVLRLEVGEDGRRRVFVDDKPFEALVVVKEQPISLKRGEESVVGHDYDIKIKLRIFTPDGRAALKKFEDDMIASSFLDALRSDRLSQQ